MLITAALFPCVVIHAWYILSLIMTFYITKSLRSSIEVLAEDCINCLLHIYQNFSIKCKICILSDLNMTRNILMLVIIFMLVILTQLVIKKCLITDLLHIKYSVILVKIFRCSSAFDQLNKFYKIPSTIKLVNEAKIKYFFHLFSIIHFVALRIRHLGGLNVTPPQNYTCKL